VLVPLDDPLPPLDVPDPVPVPPEFELVPQAAIHAIESTTGRVNSLRRLRMATRQASSEMIGVSSESGV
jgi:hypothetical protein